MTLMIMGLSKVLIIEGHIPAVHHVCWSRSGPGSALTRG